jgi:hypothetical protein
MNTSTRRVFSLVLPLVPIAIVAVELSASQAAPGRPASASKPKADSKISAGFVGLPLAFEPNEGQADPATKFISRGRGYTLMLDGDEAVLLLRRSSATDLVQMKLIGGNRAADVNGLDRLPGTSNYFIGKDPRTWRANVPNYAKVKYDGVYPGIDLVFYGNQQHLEYDFIVAPGADPDAIQLSLETADSKHKSLASKPAGVRVDATGDLVIQVAGGDLRLFKPVVYQTDPARGRRYVDGRFALLTGNRVGFKVGTYDQTQPLIIDPVLSYSTYLGGTGDDAATGIAVDASGNSYVSGFTCTTLNTGCDATVTKINATGTAVVYSSVLGGSEDDRASSVALDRFGDAYITGSTCSPDFPQTSGAFQTSLAGDCDAFVTKLDSNGGELYSSYLGGKENSASSGDEGFGIAVDSAGDAYVAGVTCTSDFPTKNGFRSTQDHCDGFAVKLHPAGGGSSDLLYSTLLGGDDGVEDATGIAVDALNKVYVSGLTTGDDFPTTDGAFQTSNAGFSDAFAVKLDMTKSGSSSLLYSTYLGGRFGEGTHSAPVVAVDVDGNIYVTGTTDSANFPTTSGAFQTSRSPDTDNAADAVLSGFVTKLKPAGKGADDLLYSTFLGGNSSETHALQGEKALAVAVGPSGNIYVAGDTCSKDFPVTSDAFQRSFAGPAFASGNLCDGFVVKLNPAGGGQSDLVYASYLGGSDEDGALAIALDGVGNAHLSGVTISTDFPHTPDAIQTTFGGGRFVTDGFVAAVPIGNFSLNPVASITADVGGSGASSVTANSIDEFNAGVTLSVSGASGVTATFNPEPVAPSPGSSASSVITVKPGLATTPGTFDLNVTGTSGLLTHSVLLQLTVRASSNGTSTVIDDLTAAGCIDNSGISGSLISKLTEAQQEIDAGEIPKAINTLNSLLNQLLAQSGKHINASCTVDGQTFNPSDVLITDVRAILATLR